MYKVTFGESKANRGIDYVSRVDSAIIKVLWGFKGTKVMEGGVDENGNEIYWITDNYIKTNPLKVTCELLAE